MAMKRVDLCTDLPLGSLTVQIGWLVPGSPSATWHTSSDELWEFSQWRHCPQYYCYWETPTLGKKPRPGGLRLL